MKEIVAEDLVLLAAGPKGLGVFANRGFRRGEAVLSFGGPLLRPEDIADFTHTIQVDEDLFLGASGDVDDYVTHSCEPSCFVESAPPELALRALRDIAPGEEVTFDYSTCLQVEPPLALCLCGAPSCRRCVVAFWDLDPATRRRFKNRGAVPGFILAGRRKVPPRPRAETRR